MKIISKVQDWTEEVGGFAMRWIIISAVLGFVGTALVVQYITDRE